MDIGHIGYSPDFQSEPVVRIVHKGKVGIRIPLKETERPIIKPRPQKKTGE
jgi:hypothetical protein